MGVHGPNKVPKVPPCVLMTARRKPATNQLASSKIRDFGQVAEGL